MGNQLKAKKIKNQIARQFFIELRELYLEDPQKQQKILIDIYKVLLRCPKDSKRIALNFNNLKLGDRNAIRILETLKNQKNISNLSLRNNQITKNSINKISELIKTCTTMNEIDLSSNQLGLSGIRELSNVLSEHQNLNGIYLNDTNIGNEGSIVLSDLIENTTNLEVLEMQDNEITSRGLGFLVEALKENYSIISLKIGFHEQLDQKDFGVLKNYIERNSVIHETLSQVISNCCQRQFRRKLTQFSKSVRGMEMLKGKNEQINTTKKGTKLYQIFQETEKRSKIDNIIDEKIEKCRWRIGFAEMMGRRETQEDVITIKTDWLKDLQIDSFWTDNEYFWDENKMKNLIDNSNYKCSEEVEKKEKVIIGELRNLPFEKAEFFGLFDGHGGREASEHVGEVLPVIIKKKILEGSKIEEAIHDSFVELHQEMIEWCLYSGTTAVVVITIEDFVWIVNLGDSKAILCRNGFTVSLTQQQKPNDKDEKKRIEKAGGFIKDGRVNGILAVSRAFGDGYLGKVISSVPEIINFRITSEDAFIVIACDGVWDVISDPVAVGIVAEEIDPQKAAKRLRDEAYNHGSTDNISVITIFFQ